MDFQRDDEQFAGNAVDAERRQKAIASISRSRSRLFALALACSIAFCFAIVAAIWNPVPVSPGLAGGGCFGTLVVWMLFFKADAEVKLLKVAERLDRRE